MQRFAVQREFVNSGGGGGGDTPYCCRGGAAALSTSVISLSVTSHIAVIISPLVFQLYNAEKCLKGSKCIMLKALFIEPYSH